MIESKGWQWELVKDDENCIWKNPCIESYYLLNRWKSQGKREFLDLGCGLGRHGILFGKNGFHVRCFDISRDAIEKTRQWAEQEGPEYQVPHFYADYPLIKKLFADFEMIWVEQIEDLWESGGKDHSAWHYHLLVRKLQER